MRDQGAELAHGFQAKSYQIPTMRLFSHYGNAAGGIEHAAGLLTPLGTNPRGGDLRLGSRGRAGCEGGGKMHIWGFAEFGANARFLTEMASTYAPLGISAGFHLLLYCTFGI